MLQQQCSNCWGTGGQTPTFPYNPHLNPTSKHPTNKFLGRGCLTPNLRGCLIPHFFGTIQALCSNITSIDLLIYKSYVVHCESVKMTLYSTLQPYDGAKPAGKLGSNCLHFLCVRPSLQLYSVQSTFSIYLETNITMRFQHIK